MSLSPLQLNAAAGLLQNQGLCANTVQNSGYQIYIDCPLISPLIQTISVGSTNGSLTSNTISTLQSLSLDCPALSNSTVLLEIDPSSPTPIYTTLGVTSLVGRVLANIIPAGNQVTGNCTVTNQQANINCGTPSNCAVTFANSLPVNGSVSLCTNVTPDGTYVNLVDANAQQSYTSFDLLACFKQPVTGNIPYLIGDFVTADQWLGQCYVEAPTYDEFAQKLLGLYLGQGDYTVFVQAYNIIQGYIQQANGFIESANIGQTYLSNTFDGMSDLITGSISSINPDTTAFAKDLRNLGQLINLDDLESLGSPLALVAQIINVAGYLPILTVSFLIVGIPQETVANIGLGNNVSDKAQKLMYEGLKLITGDSLDQILQVLGVTTEGLESAADLLDPKMIFPNSYSTLQTMTPYGYEPIYVQNAVNTELKNQLPAYVLRSTA